MSEITDLFNELAELAKTLGHPHRLFLLEHIGQGERSVERLAELSELSVANASQHLQQLRRAGFVQTRRDGKRVLYRLGEGPIFEIISALRGFATHARSVKDQLVADSLMRPDILDAVSRDELLRLLSEGSITLLDVRSTEEFELGHLPGAQNIPLNELSDRISELDLQREVIAYCRGPYCVLSSEAVEFLNSQGYKARRTMEGPPEWRAAGLAFSKA